MTQGVWAPELSSDVAKICLFAVFVGFVRFSNAILQWIGAVLWSSLRTSPKNPSQQFENLVLIVRVLLPLSSRNISSHWMNRRYVKIESWWQSSNISGLALATEVKVTLMKNDKIIIAGCCLAIASFNYEIATIGVLDSWLKLFWSTRLWMHTATPRKPGYRLAHITVIE